MSKADDTCHSPRCQKYEFRTNFVRIRFSYEFRTNFVFSVTRATKFVRISYFLVARATKFVFSYEFRIFLVARATKFVFFVRISYFSRSTCYEIRFFRTNFVFFS